MQEDTRPPLFSPNYDKEPREKSREKSHVEAHLPASFLPSEIELCASVLNRACSRIRSRDPTTRELIGERILEAAEMGERDPDRLLRYALAA
jgi:hypothetical protein